MCEPIETLSNSDLDSNSSWSVIEESEPSRTSSLENLLENVIIEDNKNQKNQLENHTDFINIPKRVDENIESISERNTNSQNKNGESGKSKVHKSKQNKHKTKKTKPETWSILAICAAVLTITGITLLCTLFPQDNELHFDTVASNHVNLKASKPVQTSDYNFPTYNYSKYNLNLIRDLNDLNLSHGTEGNSSDEGICSMDENESESNTGFNDLFNNYKPSIDELLHEIGEFEKETTSLLDMNSIKNATNKFVGGLKDAFTNGSLHILICAFMQDICLIQLLRQINKQNSTNNESKPSQKKGGLKRNKQKTSPPAVKAFGKKFSRKLDQVIRKKLANLEAFKNSNCHKNDNTKAVSVTTPKSASKYSDSHIIQKINERYNNDSGIRTQENGKSECQRRFEELDNEWETLGENHRQKIQKIKEKFKNEIDFVKENESEGSLRKQRIKLIREKYIQRLKTDREKYLLQLKRLRDERHRILTDICHQKKFILDFKDAAVGNYAILLPESYSFEQKLQNLKQKENESLGNTTIHENVSPSTANTSLKSISPSLHHIKKNNSDDSIWHQKLEETNYRKYRKYPELSTKIMKKKKNLLKSYKNKNATKPLITDSTPSTVLKPLSKPQNNETVFNVNNKLNEDTKDETEKLDSLVSDNATHHFKFAMKKEKAPEKDIYEIAFGNNGKKIKEAESVKRSLENTQARQAMQMPIFSKQDPKKSYKEKILFKGLM